VFVVFFPVKSSALLAAVVYGGANLQPNRRRTQPLLQQTRPFVGRHGSLLPGCLGVGCRFLGPPFRVAGLAFSQEAAALEPLHLQPIPNPRRYLTDTLRYGAKRVQKNGCV
jgi:hypothetical protein